MSLSRLRALQTGVVKIASVCLLSAISTERENEGGRDKDRDRIRAGKSFMQIIREIIEVIVSVRCATRVSL